MSLTEKQIEEYWEKLKDGEYMKRAITGIAEKFLTGYAVVIPYAEHKTTTNNNTEEKEMSKNSLNDLSDHLFERIEWVTDHEITGEKLKEEIQRTEAAVKAAVQIVNIANVLVKGKALAAGANGKIELPKMLEEKTR